MPITETTNEGLGDVITPIGKRVLIRKDEDKKVTKSGIHLPNNLEIPTLTGRVLEISEMVKRDLDYPIDQYDRVIYNPAKGIPVDFDLDNILYIIPIDDIVAIIERRRAK